MIDRVVLKSFTKVYALRRGSKCELSPGTLYPTLEKLRREGDIRWSRRVVAGRVRKYYRLTAKGQRELNEVKQRLNVIVSLVFS